MFMVVSSRDFVLLSYKKKEENITYGVARSIEYAPKPPIKGAVRADLKLGGWILEEVEGVTGFDNSRERGAPSSRGQTPKGTSLILPLTQWQVSKAKW